MDECCRIRQKLPGQKPTNLALARWTFVYTNVQEAIQTDWSLPRNSATLRLLKISQTETLKAKTHSSRTPKVAVAPTLSRVIPTYAKASVGKVSVDFSLFLMASTPLTRSLQRAKGRLMGMNGKVYEWKKKLAGNYF